MFKFAKYFFIVFFVTAVLPLILMFAWNNTQMEKMHARFAQNAIVTGEARLKNAVKNYLTVQEGDIFNRLYFIQSDKYDEANLKKLLKGYNVEIIQKTVKRPVSYYDVKDNDLYSFTLIPFEKTKALKISHNVNKDLLRPTGPYAIAVRLEKDNKSKYMFEIEDPLFLKPPNDSLKTKFVNKFFTYKDDSTGCRKKKKKNYNNETIANISLILTARPFGAKADSIIMSIFILLVGIVSSFVIGFIIKRIFVLPVMALSKATREIKKGNFSFRLDADGKYEIIKNIYQSFNDMADNLDTKEKLRESFISNLTHDLRTPLVAQEQSLEFISAKFKEIGLNNEYELAKSLAKNNEHLLKMVNLILETYKFDPSKLKLDITKVDLYDIVEDCREKLKPLIEEKNINFINDIYKGGLLIDADLLQLTRVFMNLISNSIDNTKQNDFIKISAKFIDEYVLITIEDNGNGIAKEDLKVIFERYYSGKSLERKLGSGFGLSVCQKIIELHNGTITVESELNKYTKFTIKLPLNNKKSEK